MAYESITLPRLLSVAAAMRAFGVGETTLRRAYQTGELAAYHPNGRDILLDAREVDEWIHKHRYRTGAEKR